MIDNVGFPTFSVRKVLHLFPDYALELSARAGSGGAAGTTAAEYLRYFLPGNRLRHREVERVTERQERKQEKNLEKEKQ